jgi:hypothetical protein
MQAENPLLPYPTDSIDGRIYYRYTVERSIGLYRISVNFGVSQEEILKTNPHLQHQGLRFGEEILIPTQQTVSQKKEHRNRLVFAADNKPKKTNQPKQKKILIQKDISLDSLQLVDTLSHDAVLADSLLINDSTVIRLAFLLPLQADAIKRDRNMDRFYDFYAGALIAIYEAQAKGQLLEVFTYDIGKTANRIKELLQQDTVLRHVDAIVGPAYSQQVEMVMDSLQHDSIWLVIPFLSRVEGINNNPYVMKFNPSELIEADTVARYLAQRKDSIQCILIEAKEGEVIPSGIKALQQSLQAYQVPTTTISLKALLSDSIEGAFSTELENLVLFNTERFVNLQTVMPHLLKACGTYRITLFSHYSWQNEKIILPQLYTSVFAPSPVIPESYNQLFEQYFNHELSSYQPRYDLLGYDLTSQLLDMLQQHKQTTHDTIPSEVWNGIQARIHYQPTATDGGYENHIVHIIHQ